MVLSFSKSPVIGVSVSSDGKLEVAQVDYQTHTIVNYASGHVDFHKAKCQIADLDIFKDTLSDLLTEINAPKGSKVVLNLPPTVFQLRDWPASMDRNNISMNIEDELNENPIFQNMDDVPHFTFTKLPNSTIQTSKIVYSAISKGQAIELAMIVKDLDYKLVAMDTSLNSTLNALIYSGNVDAQPGSSWVMVIVEENSCRVVPMQGSNYVDVFQENISIGEVLGDAENYDTVVNAINPIISRVPSQLLYVISKTDLINAEILASKLIYNAQIVHLNTNSFSKACLLEAEGTISPNTAKTISADVIGAAIRQGFSNVTLEPMNMFNQDLGDIYLSQTPPIINGIELSVENMLKYGLAIALVLFVLGFGISKLFSHQIFTTKAKIQDLDSQIQTIQKFIDDNKDISSSTFSESDEVRIGVNNNKNVYSYYTIVGTEIPKKLWLTSLSFGKFVSISGQSDNIESVYSFFRNIKDYNPSSGIKLQKLGLATSTGLSSVSKNGDFDTESILSSLNADFYEFVISNGEEPVEQDDNKKQLDNGLTDLPDLN